MSSQTSPVLKRLFLGATIAMSIAFSANAQRSSGGIVGTAVSGDTVVVHGKDTGWRRELNIKKDGKFTLSYMPTGIYVVTITHADGTHEPAKLVAVRVGTTARVK